MGKGVLYKANGSAWSKSQAKKANGSAWSNGKVQHANGSVWYDNFPMEQVYTQTFNVVWTQAYNGSGVKLDAATWGDHPRSGDSVNFQGLFGFDRNAMVAFVAGGVVQSLKFTCMFDDPSHAGNPTVNFCPHVYTSKPNSWSAANLNKNYKATSQFYQTGADFARTITLPVSAWNNVNMSGVAIYGTTAAGDSARFAGKTTSHGMNAYTSKLEIQVLK
jgi:hypothetical protein